MKALVYNLSIPKYLASSAAGRIFPRRYFAKLGCLGLKEIPAPKLPSQDWVLVKTEACGICGSDLNLLMGRESFSMEPYSSFPAVLGHEAVGRVEELGTGIEGFAKGDLVAIDSILPCVTRGIEPACDACQKGDYALCKNFTQGELTPGPVNGFNASVGGGFGEYLPAHKSQLFKIGNDLSLYSAVLTDPLASALQPAATHLPKNDEPVLVYGAGIIGILLINSLRALGFKGKIIAIVRHDFQKAHALNAGADHIIDGNIFDSFTELTGAKKLKPTLGKPVFEGGIDLIFDCVGSAETVDNSLRFLNKRGKLVIVGTSGVLKSVDASPVWFKEVTITGSAMYSYIMIEGQKIRTYKAALDMLDHGNIKTDGLVTHKFTISQFKQAINTALDKRTHKSIKVVFTH